MNTDGIPRLIERLVALQHAGGGGGAPPPLNAGGGDGRFPDMEARVAKLEAHMEHVRDDLAKLSGVPAELARLSERVSHLPTKDELGAKLRNYLAIAGGVTTVAVAAITWIPKLLHG